MVEMLAVFEGDQHLCLPDQFCVHGMIIYYLEYVPDASDLN